MDYSFTVVTKFEFEEAIQKITEELKKEGFGILARIDLDKKFKEKLNIDFKKYSILEACNPSNALEAIEVEENIGLFLPCNVIVYEKDNSVIISSIKPYSLMALIENEKLSSIAKVIEEKLLSAIKRV